MSDEAQQEPAWRYWKARALLASGREAQRAEALRLFESLASPSGFYEQLALEELGRRVAVPPRPAPLTPEEREAARLNPSLNRALYAILIGLRPEGNREWVYATALERAGGMGERELLAAAQMACEREVWDRCINTSERTREAFDVEQRFPMPHRESVVRRSQAIGLDPAYVYGLIRQESRFIMDARSHVGASGLMQVMPATARWTARKLGMSGFRPEQLTDRETNITIGTAYLKLALDDLDGSMPLAAAAYNAGPRPPAHLAQRPGDRGGRLGREHPVRRDPRLRQEGAGQHHPVRRHPDRPAAVAEGAPGPGRPARRRPARAERRPALIPWRGARPGAPHVRRPTGANPHQWRGHSESIAPAGRR